MGLISICHAEGATAVPSGLLCRGPWLPLSWRPQHSQNFHSRRPHIVYQWGSQQSAPQRLLMAFVTEVINSHCSYRPPGLGNASESSPWRIHCCIALGLGLQPSPNCLTPRASNLWPLSTNYAPGPCSKSNSCIFVSQELEPALLKDRLSPGPWSHCCSTHACT